MAVDQETKDESVLERRVTQSAIRLSLLALLVLWCLRVLSPFVEPVVAGAVIAIALHTPYEKLKHALGERPKLAAVALVILALFVLILPTIALGASLVETAADLSSEFVEDEFTVPPPPEAVAQWPIVGERVYGLWLSASQNLESALIKLGPQFKEIGLWLVSAVGDLGLSLVMIVVAIIIAGVLLPNGQSATLLARKVALLVAGESGPELVKLVSSSVMSVTKGVLGVAVIQSLLAGIAMLVVGVPAAGLWTLLILILVVVQLPSMLVLLPVILYVFSTSSTLTAVLFAIWSVLVGLSDNVLKPLLMGRGSSVPMLVLFLGSLGGFMASGILGLFVGAVVLSLGYTVFMAWVGDVDESAS